MLLTIGIETELLEAGFTGVITDKRGRKIHYANGKRIKNPQADAAKPAKGKAAGTAKRAKKGSPEAVAAAKQAVADVLKGNSKVTPDAMVGHLDALTVAQLSALHKEHGVKAPGKLRAQLVDSVKAKMGKSGKKLGELPADRGEEEFDLFGKEATPERMSQEKPVTPIDEMPKESYDEGVGKKSPDGKGEKMYIADMKPGMKVSVGNPRGLPGASKSKSGTIESVNTSYGRVTVNLDDGNTIEVGPDKIVKVDTYKAKQANKV